VVGDLAVIPSKTRFDVHSRWETEIGSNSRFDKLAPSLLSVSTLHPLLVDLAQFLVGFRRKFRELSHKVVEDFIIDPSMAVRG